MPWAEKSEYLTDLNYRMYLAGYPEEKRRNITIKVINNYSRMLKEHQESTKLMYRSPQEQIKKKKTAMWFKDEGYDYNVAIPAMEDDQLKMKEKLEKISGKKILMTEKYGTTALSSLKSSRSGLKCERKKCNICRHGGTKDDCQRSNCNYRIMCNRFPCTNQLDMKKVTNEDDFRRQMEKIKPGNGDIPSVYQGETFRSPFLRGRQHTASYNNPKERKTNFMWLHTEKYHGGIIGEDKGIDDYKMVVTDFHSNNLDRQTREGLLQTRNERYQQLNKLRVLNSQIDFNKPLRTKLTVLRKDKEKDNLPQEPVGDLGQKTDSQIDKMLKLARQKTDRIKHKFPHRQPKTGRRRLNVSTDRICTQQDNSQVEFKPSFFSTPQKRPENPNILVKKIVTLNC